MNANIETNAEYLRSVIESSLPVELTKEKVIELTLSYIIELIEDDEEENEFINYIASKIGGM